LQYHQPGVTHVLVDEVHERGVDTDFLLCLLKELLPRRNRAYQEYQNKHNKQKQAVGRSPNQNQNQRGPLGEPPLPLPLKVVLMSATMSAPLFTNYFTNKYVYYCGLPCLLRCSIIDVVCN
jgi:HrpA-like RNA helicase